MTAADAWWHRGFMATAKELVIGCAAAVREIMTTPGLRERLARGARTRALEFNFQHLVRTVYLDFPPGTSVQNDEYSPLQSCTSRFQPSDASAAMRDASAVGGRLLARFGLFLLFSVIFLPEFLRENGAGFLRLCQGGGRFPLH